MMDQESRIIQRYFRKTELYPDGAVIHHGDCDVFSIKICTCGLLHDLMPVVPELQEKLYPKYWEEHTKSEEARELLLHRKPKKRKK